MHRVMCIYIYAHINTLTRGKGLIRDGIVSAIGPETPFGLFGGEK